MTDTDTLSDFERAGLLQAMDVAFARMLRRITGHDDPLALLGAALAFRAPREGHVCLDVSRAATVFCDGEEGHVSWPEVTAWLQALRAAPFVREGRDGQTPLVLDGVRLYLERYFYEECRLADEVLARAGGNAPEVPISDPVERAAYLAARGGLVLVTGGPGTGKTTAAARILASLAREGRDPDRVALLAPTGKAASRLAEAVREGLAGFGMPDEVRGRFRADGMTIHRAIGLHPDRPFAAPRACDLAAVVVDEASMMDLVVAARLFQAVPRTAPVILLGDPHQLASVEAGSVFADLCEAAPLAGVRVRLSRTWRYGGAIADLAEAVVSADEARVVAVLQSGGEPVSLVNPHAMPGWRDSLRAMTVEGLAPYLAAVEAGDAVAALDAARRFRILCAVRRGPFGCEVLNRSAASWLRRDVSRRWYLGRVVLITANDPDTGLFNGDTGVTIPTPDGPRVFFEGGEPGAVRSFPPARLPPHEDAFAITIHKSQGSQFERVAVVLPPVPSPILTRELLYTGVTRARNTVTLFAPPDIVRLATRAPTVRASGLRERLDRLAITGCDAIP